MGVDERIADVERARDALRRGSWAEAYEALASLDPSSLTAQDLEGFADAAWWLSKADESMNLRQSAYAAYAAAGEDPPAAGVAVRLCFERFLRGEPAVAMGWLMQAQRHLHGHPECIQHGFLALCQAVVGQNTGDLEGAKALSEQATQIGQRLGDRDLVALGIHVHGLALIAEGRVREGMALLDEAMTSVVAGQLDRFFTGVIYCNVLDACLDVADLARAGEWSEAARAWCRSLPPESPFPGLCRINRATVAGLRGDWSEAASEAQRVSEDSTFSPEAAARAFYETGEIRRRIGNVAGAEEAFARAHELGFEPQPGLALLRLAQGKGQSALTALRLAVGGETGNRLRRARLLAAQVDVAIAANDLGTAASASDELESIAHDFGTPALEASAMMAGGALRLAEGDANAALDSLRGACTIWQDLRVPYETARSRILYGVALRSVGDDEGALLEFRAALSTFERLGAVPEARKAAELLAPRGPLPRGLTGREAQVLALVASGRTNREIAAELVLSEHTVARHLQNIFGKLEISSRSAATAFAFEHGLA
jgi:DNA-binding CsgD family transcriptional regulator